MPESYRYTTFDDLPLIIEMLGDPQVGTWLWFTPAPREAFEAYFRPLLERQAEELAAGTPPQKAVFTVESDDGEFLGHGGCLAVDGSPGGFEIGFQLKRAAWGRGVGMRFGKFLYDQAVDKCGAYRIEAACLEGNAGSRAILEKLGLRLEGTRPGYRLKGDTRHTELLYGAKVPRPRAT